MKTKFFLLLFFLLSIAKICILYREWLTKFAIFPCNCFSKITIYLSSRMENLLYDSIIFWQNLLCIFAKFGNIFPRFFYQDLRGFSMIISWKFIIFFEDYLIKYSWIIFITKRKNLCSFPQSFLCFLVMKFMFFPVISW